MVGAALGALVLQALAAGPRSPEQQVLDAARDTLAQRADRDGWVEPQFDLALLPPRSPLAPCRAPLAVEPVDTRHASRLRLAVRCPDTDGWEQTVTVKAAVSARVAIAATAVPAGRELTAADVDTERRDITSLPDAVADPDKAIGQSSRRALRSGDTLRSAWLTAPVLVRRGEAVRIVAQRDGISVTVAGEAQEAGARGAVVRVRNVGNGKVIRARVIDEGTVAPVDL